MKKLLFTFLSLFMLIHLAFGGGIVTNTNQSVGWVRMLARDASTSINAVYFNPAGLTKLSDGLHVSINNQTILQSKITSNSLFPGREWVGKVTVPSFPSLFAAYKKGKMAFSLGFGPIGGGGSAVYDDGVPMIEMPLLGLYDLPNVTGYSVDANFTGSSIYFGIQGGITYAINDMISVYAGARYVLAVNKYVGEIKNISVTTPSATVRADTYMNGVASNLHGYADGVSSFATALGSSSYTFDQAITATGGNAQLTALKNGLISLGVANAGSLSLAAGEATYDAYGNGISAKATLMADQSADVVQKGHGFTPIVGLNLSFLEDKFNIGMKYEFKTNMEVTNETPEGKGFVIGMTTSGVPVEMFPDGEKTNADMPAMLSVGAAYKFSDKFNASVGYHRYFDKETGWSVVTNSNPEISKVDKDFWEVDLGFEYALNEKILLSCGYLIGITGVNDYFYSDLTSSLSSNTLGLGGLYKINDLLSFELGLFNSWYDTANIVDTKNSASVQTYKKSNYGFALGLNLNFGGK
jgi:long-chain fatty acid transport protein